MGGSYDGSYVVVDNHGSYGWRYNPQSGAWSELSGLVGIRPYGTMNSFIKSEGSSELKTLVNLYPSTLPTSEEAWYVRTRAKDANHLHSAWSPVREVIIDIFPPTYTEFSFDIENPGSPEWVSDPTIELNILGASDNHWTGELEMKVSNNSSGQGYDWMPYQTSLTWELDRDYKNYVPTCTFDWECSDDGLGGRCLPDRNLFGRGRSEDRIPLDQGQRA